MTKKSVAEQYDAWAAHYAYMYGTPADGVAYFTNTIGRRVAETIGRGRVVDVGCGVGLSTAGLLEHGLDVVGVDVSEGSLRVAEKTLRPYAGRYELQVADARDLSRFAGGFDAVVAVSSLCEHILDADEQRRAVHEIAKAARPGGHVFIDGYDHENLMAEAPDDELRYAAIAELPGGNAIYVERRHYHGTPRSRLYDTDYVLIEDDGGLTRISIPGRAIFLREYLAWLREDGLADVQALAPARTGMYKHLCKARRPAAGEQPAEPADTTDQSAPVDTNARMTANLRPKDLPANIFEERPAYRRSMLIGSGTPGAPNVIARRNQSTLVMFSGGIDSTYALAKILRESRDDVIAHHIHFKNPEGRDRAEAAACQAIVAHLQRTVRAFMVTECTIDRSRFRGFGLDSMAVGFEVGIVSRSFTLDMGRSIDRWTAGICLEEELDEFGTSDTHETQFMLQCAAAASHPYPPPRFFQLPITPKRTQMDDMGTDLVDLCWTCRRPVWRADGTAQECGACKTCLLMADIRAGRGTIADRPGGPET